MTIFLVMMSVPFLLSAEPQMQDEPFFSEGMTGDLGLPKEYARYLPPSRDSIAMANRRLPSKHAEKITAPRNQGSCGSCWTFAAIGALESKIMRKWGAQYKYDLSEQEVLSCLPNGCGGGWPLKAFNYWRSRGLAKYEKCIPYKGRAASCDYYKRCNDGVSVSVKRPINLKMNGNNAAQVKGYIKDLGPGTISYRVNSDFQRYWNNGRRGQVYKYDGRSKFVYRHVVMVYGWDDSKQAWMAQNSWGRRGPNGDGTFLMPYSQWRVLDYYYVNAGLN